MPSQEWRVAGITGFTCQEIPTTTTKSLNIAGSVRTQNAKKAVSNEKVKRVFDARQGMHKQYHLNHG